MIPIVDKYLEPEQKQEIEPSKTFKMSGKRIAGFIDELEAVKQAAWKRLNTEKGVYEIYSKDYGLQTLDLIGTELRYAVARLKSRIAETLAFDERILNTRDFRHELDVRRLTIYFSAESVYGSFDMVLEVQI